MKINDGFRLRSVLGQQVIVAEGAQQVNFNKLISLNETAALLWSAAEGRDFTVADLADTLVEKYNIDLDTAISDVKDITGQWLELGLISQ